MSVKCLIYCSRGKLLERHWKKIDGIGKFILYHHSDKVKYCDPNSPHRLNGKIVASFDCEKVEEFTTDYRGNKEQNKRIAKDSCVPLGDLVDYQKENHLLYAIHISNLEIFDEPKELSEYLSEYELDFRHNLKENSTIRIEQKKYLKNSPQNMCYAIDNSGLNNYVLISIKPEWVAKILNGEKTIEVRKQVVNALKELI